MSTTSTQTIQVPLPELGESVTEGTIIEWRVAEGATVAAGDILLDLTTDKVDVEVPAPAAGRLVSILAQAGDTVEVGTALAEIDTSGDGAGPEPEGAPAAEAPAAEAPAQEASGERVAIVLPEMESVTEGVVIEWRVGEGDAVAADQVVVEVSTDKVDIEVPAPASGVLVSIAVPDGETFPITTPLGEIASGPAPTPSPEAAAAPPAADGLAFADSLDTEASASAALGAAADVAVEETSDDVAARNSATGAQEPKVELPDETTEVISVAQPLVDDGSPEDLLIVLGLLLVLGGGGLMLLGWLVRRSRDPLLR